MRNVYAVNLKNLIESLTFIYSFQTLTRSRAPLKKVKLSIGEKILQIWGPEKPGFFHITL